MPVPDPLELRSLALEIYGGCNYRCHMCPQAEGRESSFVRRLPFELFRKIIDEALPYGLQMVSLQGSGEPTLHPDMPEFVAFAKSRGLQVVALTNGLRLDESLGRRLLDAGLDVLRVSAVGWDAASYARWMGEDAFERVREQTRSFAALAREGGGATRLTLYHLVTHASEVELQVERYRQAWIRHCEAPGEIWMMHNWGGSYVGAPYVRSRTTRRSCGRPHAPSLTVRAGGNDGHHGAVVPCCFVLGQDSRAVLGHLDTQSIEEVVSGAAYRELRDRHRAGDFDAIDYCRGCDQLFDAPESLVWTNIPGKAYGQAKTLQDLDFRRWARSD